jgi:LysM repeat protein
LASLDELKQKYAGVFQVLEHDGANIQTLEMQGDKLHLVATVVSEASKDRVWDAIKAADPSYSDLVHEITVAQGDQTYTVKAGDNLSKISKLYYGNANQYEKIAKANGLDNPDKIRVGQTLTIPAA